MSEELRWLLRTFDACDVLAARIDRHLDRMESLSDEQRRMADLAEARLAAQARSRKTTRTHGSPYERD